MTPISNPPDDPMTQAEFADELDDLVAAVRDDDLSIEGAQNVRSPIPETPDYTVEISEITPREPSWLRGDTTE